MRRRSVDRAEGRRVHSGDVERGEDAVPLAQAARLEGGERQRLRLRAALQLPTGPQAAGEGAERVRATLASAATDLSAAPGDAGVAGLSADVVSRRGRFRRGRSVCSEFSIDGSSHRAAPLHGGPALRRVSHFTRLRSRSVASRRRRFRSHAGTSPRTRPVNRGNEHGGGLARAPLLFRLLQGGASDRAAHRGRRPDSDERDADDARTVPLDAAHRAQLLPARSGGRDGVASRRVAANRGNSCHAELPPI